jgi:transglutaminase-like putative cysteine protease
MPHSLRCTRSNQEGGSRTAAWWRRLAPCTVLAICTGGDIVAGNGPIGQGVHIGPPPAWVEAVSIQAKASLPAEQVSGGTEYLLLDRQVRVDGAMIEAYNHVAKRIANDAGLEGASRVSVDFDPSYQSLVLHAVRLRRGHRTLDRLAPDQLKVIQRETDLEYQVYDGSLSAFIFLEDLRVGDVVEYQYTLRGANPVLEGRYFDSFTVDWSVPIHHLRERLLWPSGRRLLVRNHGTTLQPVVRQVGEATERVWERRDLPAINPDGEVPGWFDSHGWVQLSEVPSWSEVADWGMKLYQAAAGPSAELGAQVARCRQQGSTDVGRALAAIHFVQDEVRYLGLEVGESSHRPTDPTIVLKRRFGDCKDKALLLVMMLRALGIKAAPALVNTYARQGLDERLPSPLDFNHVVVAIDYGNERFWVDPTREEQGGGLSSLYLPPYRRALVLAPGSTGLATIPDWSLDRPSVSVEETLLIKGIGDPVDYTVCSRYEGADADSERGRFRNESRENIEKSYLNFYAARFPSIKRAASVELQDDREANVVKVTEHYAIAELWRVNESGKNKEFTLRAYTIEDALGKPATTVRTMPLALYHPQFLRHTIEICLPSDWKVKPEHTEVAASEMRFQFRSTYARRHLRLEYELRTLSDWLPADKAKAYVDHINTIRDSLSYSLWYPAAGRTADVARATGVNWPILAAVVIVLPLFGLGAFWLLGYDPAAGAATQPNTPVASAPMAIDVPAPNAAGTPPSGLGGWLVLVGIGVVASPIRIAFDLAQMVPTYSLARWNALTVPGATAYHPLWAPLLLFELLGNIAMLVGAVALVPLYFGKRRSFARLFPSFMVLVMVFLGCDAVLARQLPAVDHSTLSEQNITLLKSAVAALIWTLYFRSSRRVRATFVRGPVRTRHSALT